MNSFNFKRRSLVSGPHLLGTLLIVAAVFAFVSPVIFTIDSSAERVVGVGVGAMLLGLVVLSSYGGTLIDFTGKRMKEYVSICGYKIGEWTALPVILTVKVVSSSYRSTNTPNGISPTLSGRVTDFRALLYSNAPTPVLSFVYSNRAAAVKQATRLASNLNADLVLSLPDST